MIHLVTLLWHQLRLGIVRFKYPSIHRTFMQAWEQCGRPPITISVLTNNTQSVRTSRSSILVRADYERRPVVDIMFAIAHEMSHIMLKHRSQRESIYRFGTDQQLIEFNHQSEFDADHSALRIMKGCGYSKYQVIQSLLNLERSSGTTTHPSTFLRVLNLQHSRSQYAHA